MAYSLALTAVAVPHEKPAENPAFFEDLKFKLLATIDLCVAQHDAQQTNLSIPLVAIS
jgi:hypothetical protein